MSDLTVLEKQLLHACLSASTYLQDLPTERINEPEAKKKVQDELTLAIQAATK